MITEIQYSRKFLKHYQKRIAEDSNLSSQFSQRVKLFVANPRHPSLKTHKLVGSKRKLHSFSITGDIRVIYKKQNSSVLFLDIGTHNQVY